MVGDGVNSDIRGANNAGIDACWYNPSGKTLPEGLELVHETVSGRLRTLILRGNPDETLQKLQECEPLFLDAVPLSLEEIFIYELGGADYAVKDILL